MLVLEWRGGCEGSGIVFWLQEGGLENACWVGLPVKVPALGYWRVSWNDWIQQFPTDLIKFAHVPSLE